MMFFLGVFTINFTGSFYGKMCTVWFHQANNVFFAYVLVMQKDVKSDPKIIQDVSIATDSLLESLGALAVEVSTP